MQQKGFTLTELMIVVAIVSILVAIAIPQFNEFQKKAAHSAPRSQPRNFLTMAMHNPKKYSAAKNTRPRIMRLQCTHSENPCGN